MLCHLFQQFLVFVGERLGCVPHDQYHIGIGQGFHGFLYSDAFGFIQGSTNSGRIYKLYRNAANRNRFGDKIAGSSRSCGHDGAIAFN